MQGTALYSHTHTILQPLFRLRLETWADFSTRLPARQVRTVDAANGGQAHGWWAVAAALDAAGRPCWPVVWQPAVLFSMHTSTVCHAWPSASCYLQVDGGAFVPVDTEALAGGAGEARPPLSAEGGPQRCFRSMYVCTAGGEIDVSNWPTHGFGLALVDAYRDQLAAWRQQQRDAQQAQQGQHAGDAAAGGAVQAKSVAAGTAGGSRGSLRAGTGGGAASNSASQGTERVLRVLFQRRDSDRLLLNSQELVERCNRWRYTARSGERLRASCAEVNTVGGYAAGWQAGWAGRSIRTSLCLSGKHFCVS